MLLSQRQADMSFKEIVSKLENPRPMTAGAPPRCYFVNQLGVMSLVDKRAEEKLRELLPGETGDNEKFAAFIYLILIDNPDPETVEVIENFIANPENDKFLKPAEEKTCKMIQKRVF